MEHLNVDFGEVRRATDLLAQAESMMQLGAGLEAATAAVGFSDHLALEMSGVQPQLTNALHNLDGVDLASVVQSDLAARMLAAPISAPMGDELGVERFRSGVAASALNGSRACLLFLGRPAPLPDNGSLVELLGATSILVSYLLDALVRLGRQSCPLSERELACMCMATNGLSAKETARRLGISHRTVEDYLANCRSRLNATTTLSAALHALRKGWLSWADIEAAEVSSVSLRLPRSKEC